MPVESDQSLFSARGTLVVLGGGDDDPMLARLARMLPERTAPIEILTTATRRQPARTAVAYAHTFRQLGCPNVGHLEVDEDHAAEEPATLARLRQARLVFMSGGDQERLTDFLLGTEFLAILKEKYQQEETFIIAGTSAGASALASFMLIHGHGWRSHMVGQIAVAPGLNLIPGILLDQHFAERQRYPRLLHAVLAQPHLLGIGLSEETGLIIRPNQPAEVFGEEVIVVIDGAGVSYSNLPGLPEDEMISGHGFRLHILTTGQRIDLITRQPMAQLSVNSEQ
jgi:cyanophycinase